MTIQEKMEAEWKDKSTMSQAQEYAFAYMEQVNEKRIYPTETELKELRARLKAPLNEAPASAGEVLQELQELGALGTVSQTGGRYYGFVNGAAVPASLAVKWLSDVWDQCGGLYLTSPLNAEIEMLCEQWLKDIFQLPESTVAGFVSGTSMANFSALAAARFRLLKKQGWDINQKGLYGAPPIRIIAHEQVHSSIKKTLCLLGFGLEMVEWIPADEQGRIIVESLPEIDDRCLILLQAGNVNTGAYDDFDSVCAIAEEQDAWVHVDGAFGLWAGAVPEFAHLAKGMNRASSWSVDGHKTLNTPYDSGIVMCKDADALMSALQATGEYLIYSDRKDPLLSTPEMSKRARAIELWASMKSLGKRGIAEMVYGFNQRAKQMGAGLKAAGYQILNEVVFNQVLVRANSPEQTRQALSYIQNSGVCWCGGTTWNGEPAIRVSICSWRTNEEDIERSVEVFAKAMQLQTI